MSALGQGGNRVIVTVLGKDQVGIIAWISTVLAGHNANILDISQTILQEFFTMIMIVDLSAASLEFNELREILASQGDIRGLKVTMQHEDVFQFMHRI
ncbi:MAG TPA: ACT domain-containing protein [Verrucomicrobiae bacterium]|nr:ACT domain-containing protein [Verrucomicrobiae bacterium]